MPQKSVDIVQAELRPIIELQWGIDAARAMEASFITHYLIQFLHPGYRDGRAIKMYVRYRDSEQMESDLDYLDSLYRAAKIPDEPRSALAALKKRASAFNFESGYRKRGSEAHKLLFEHLIKLVEALNKAP